MSAVETAVTMTSLLRALDTFEAAGRQIDELEVAMREAKEIVDRGRVQHAESLDELKERLKPVSYETAGRVAGEVIGSMRGEDGQVHLVKSRRAVCGKPVVDRPWPLARRAGTNRNKVAVCGICVAAVRLGEAEREPGAFEQLAREPVAQDTAVP